MNATEITVILCCQDQGRHLQPTVASLAMAIEKASSQHGIKIEWLFAADRLSSETEEYLQSHLPRQARTIYNSDGASLAALTQAVKEARGKFISIVGGNDLVSGNWLSKAYAFSAGLDNKVILHPEMIILFGERTLLYITPDQKNWEQCRELSFARNLWPGIVFGVKELFTACPFYECNQVDQFEQSAYYCHWQWISNTLAENIVHQTVPGTFSCCHEQHKHNCVGAEEEMLLPPSSKLFQLVSGEGGGLR